ncbi:IgGFc-binding protein-like [Saccostrea echinata]|uniref:IgGFc-binding protein-like n=1 Tax=Saccostrea echinata TaxID=191078 RepID=UPI002A800771|nr:IgGFc-binding protein-like [Saccostrea echinata]
MPCKNGGTCTDTDTSYTCMCNTGWTGQNCTGFDGDFKHEYVFMIMKNHHYASNQSSLIYMTTNTPATVEISTSNNLNSSLKSAIDKTFFFTSQLKITLPPEMQSVSFKTEPKAMKIRSTEAITVVLFDNNYSQSNDGSLISPVVKLGTRYLVVSTDPRDEMHPVYASVFAIAALEDDTLVKINLMVYDAEQNSSATETFEIPMNNLETIQLEHYNDLSGSLVESSKPVAVFSGNRCNMFPESIRCSHLMEQMSPTTEWGSMYIVPADFNSDGSLLIIMTDGSSSTTASILVGYDRHDIILLPRIPFEFTLRANETAVIYIPQARASVTSFVKGNKNNSNSGSPYMVKIPEVPQNKSQYSIPIPEGYLTNYVTIMIDESSKSDLRLNGQAIEQTKVLFEDANILNDGRFGSILTVEVSPGVLNLATTSGSPFGLLVFGYRYLDSYGFAGNFV